MQLDNEDRNYLDGHFKDTHEKINENGKAIVALETAFNGHKKNPCPNIVKHWKTEGKIIIGLIAGLGLIFTILQYFFG